jgi:hypothetical protein
MRLVIELLQERIPEELVSIQLRNCYDCFQDFQNAEAQIMQHITSSYLLALQPCVGLGFLHGFVTANFSVVGSLAPHPTPNLKDQGLHFFWPLHFDLSGMGGPTRSLRSRQHSSPGHWGAQTSCPRGGCSIQQQVEFCQLNCVAVQHGLLL